MKLVWSTIQSAGCAVWISMGSDLDSLHLRGSAVECRGFEVCLGGGLEARDLRFKTYPKQ